jgi:predicted SprT family Zn-dependent metalloprotease
MAATPTAQIYDNLTTAYGWFNEHLFDGELVDCVMVLQRRKNARGYFWAEQWQHRSDDVSADEIALNPDTFIGRSVEDILSTLVHEMCHLWQHHYGKPSRNGYHNKEWGGKMVEVGLIPSATGEEGGKQTGQKMTHYIADDGAFSTTCAELTHNVPLPGLEWFTIQAVARKAKGNSKTKYVCPECDATVWGKPDLNVTCGDCEVALEPA